MTGSRFKGFLGFRVGLKVLQGLLAVGGKPGIPAPQKYERVNDSDLIL